MSGEITAVIADVVGYDALCELSKQLGGAYWYIPKSPPSEMRNERIREAFEHILKSEHGYTMMTAYREIARRFGVSESTVRRAVSAQSSTVYSA